jgi:nicotinate-nucleotide pyrophosphorylase (carboxylating)
MACGSIKRAIESARQISSSKPVEVEVESMDELEQALSAKADIIMLDNFSVEMLNAAVILTDGRAKLEASGGITHETLVPIAETGVDYISIGALTKDCQSIDLSMRISL